MRVAVQNPIYWLGKNSLHPWVGQFILDFKPALYFTRPEYYALFLWRFAKEYGPANLLKVHGTPIFSEDALKPSADALVCFNGVPDREAGKIASRFDGLKIYHTMDYFSNSSACSSALEKGDVDYAMAYSNSGEYDPYFRKYFPKYRGRTIPVPFGFGERFRDFTPFGKRHPKCVAVGSVTPLRSPKAAPDSPPSELEQFFSSDKYLHRFRDMLRANEADLHPVLDSFLAGAKVQNLYSPNLSVKNDSWVGRFAPARKFEGKRFDYNIVDVFNQYMMFTTCETVLNFPNAKIFEGAAAGCGIVCSGGKWHSDLGLVDGENCIMHKQYDLADFRKRAEWALSHRGELEAISANGKKLVREKYSPQAIAKALYLQIEKASAGKLVG